MVNNLFFQILIVVILMGNGIAGSKKSPIITDNPVNQKDTLVLAKMICPIAGEPANKDVYLDYKSPKADTATRYYFCCKGCIGAFKENPEKYIAKINKQRLHQAEHSASKKTNMSASEKVNVMEFEVFGMDCPGCHGGLNKLIEILPGVKKSEANWEKQFLRVYVKKGATVKAEDVKKAIRDANFTPGKQLK